MHFNGSPPLASRREPSKMWSSAPTERMDLEPSRALSPLPVVILAPSDGYRFSCPNCRDILK